MSLSLDKNYNIEISLKDSKFKKDKNIELYTTDKGIFNIFVKLVDDQHAVIPNAEKDNYTVEMRIVRPDLASKRVALTKHSTDDCFEVDLGEDVITTDGTYKFEFLITKDTEQLTTNNDSFKITKSITDGLVEAHSLSIMSLKELSPNLKIDNLKESKLDDVKFDGKTMTFYADGNVVRKCYLDKSNVSLEELVEEQPYKAGKGVDISKNGVISISTNSLKALIREVLKEGGNK